MVATDYSTWLTAHRDVADHVFCDETLKRLDTIRERLEGHGYKLKLDVGKRTTRATVFNSGFRSKESHPSLAAFMGDQEARLAGMDRIDAKFPDRPLASPQEA